MCLAFIFVNVVANPNIIYVRRFTFHLYMINNAVFIRPHLVECKSFALFQLVILAENIKLLNQYVWHIDCVHMYVCACARA